MYKQSNSMNLLNLHVSENLLPITYGKLKLAY